MCYDVSLLDADRASHLDADYHWDWPRKWRKRGPNVTIGISHGILPVLAEEVAQEWTGRYNPRSVSEMELSTQRGGELEYSDA
jgi:hypothetical protein